MPATAAKPTAKTTEPKKARPTYTDEIKARSKAITPRTGPDTVQAVHNATVKRLKKDKLPLTAENVTALIVDGKADADLVKAAKATCKWVTPTNATRCLVAHAAQLAA